MGKDDEMMRQLASQLGLHEKRGGEKYSTGVIGAASQSPDMAAAEAKAKKYINKSDEEILNEIRNLKEALKKDRRAYDKQIAMIRGMEAMMSGEQKRRLKRILELLED